MSSTRKSAWSSSQSLTSKSLTFPSGAKLGFVGDRSVLAGWMARRRVGDLFTSCLAAFFSTLAVTVRLDGAIGQRTYDGISGSVVVEFACSFARRAENVTGFTVVGF
ncbi:hypothetical protein CERZMDRAFT_97602 [Cercospora zeae-maydis SCOH1-5]|uniref:Uncharacterized protein n=1 Tax=Cercospora zeae-maydis SCOH1-5 TaxID=717836 RepID=A0A6A6FG14_9PEZI|nr:hypothetical protein CERZMDRAFT_97602 [Cercospora zeae-maydis SCOH1-5]